MVSRFSAWVLGITLVVGGVLFLLLSTGIITYTGPIEPVLAGGVGLLALPFLGRWLVGRDQWWALITAYVFLALAVPLLLLWQVPDIWQVHIIVTLIEIGLPFIAAYLFDSTRWWGALLGYAAFAFAGAVGLSFLTTSQEIFGAYGLIMAAVPLWAIFIGDRSRTWAFVPALVVSALGVLLLGVTGIVAIARQGFFYVVLNGGVALALFGIYAFFRRFDWALWLGIGFTLAAGLSIFFPPTAGFAALALTIGSYIITKQIDSTRAAKQSPAQQPPPQAQPAATAVPPSQPASTPPAASSPPAQPPPAQTPNTAAQNEIQAAAERANTQQDEGTPLTGFRPLNPFEGRDEEESG